VGPLEMPLSNNCTIRNVERFVSPLKRAMPPWLLVTKVAFSKELERLSDEVMKFVMQARAADPSLSLQQLAHALQQKFDLTVHPRSIERQLRRQKKLQ